MRGNAQRDGRPLGESKLWSYFSPFMHRSRPTSCYVRNFRKTTRFYNFQPHIHQHSPLKFPTRKKSKITYYIIILLSWSRDFCLYYCKRRTVLLSRWSLISTSYTHYDRLSQQQLGFLFHICTHRYRMRQHGSFSGCGAPSTSLTRSSASTGFVSGSAWCHPVQDRRNNLPSFEQQCTSVFVIILSPMSLTCHTGRDSGVRSTSTNQLAVPPFNLSSVCKRALPVSGANFWNSLPSRVTSCTVAGDIQIAS